MEEFNILLEKIKEYNRIFIFGHVRPDGDCFGSIFGLRDIIRSTFPKKEVYCLEQDVKSYHFLGRVDDISDNFLFNDALAIVCDTATRERIADQRYKYCKEIIKVDHHLVIDDYGTYNIDDENIAATCLLISKFYFKYKDELKITNKGINALYTGIVTDTSNFKFRGVNYETFDLAGKLVELGADIEYINSKLSIEQIRNTKLKSYLYKSLKVSKNGVVHAKIKKSILFLYNVAFDEASNLVNLLANIEDCPVWILFIQYPKEIRVRIRSNGPDINMLAEKYGGGGHQKAAGASVKSWRQTKRLIKDANELVKCYKENIPYEIKM